MLSFIKEKVAKRKALKLLSFNILLKNNLRNLKMSKKQFDKKYPRIKCMICYLTEKETKTNRLVRDHNHKTGMIRGWLCDPCNGRLGAYESGKYGSSVTEWSAKHEKELADHLATCSGIPYDGKTKERTFAHQLRMKDQKIHQLEKEIKKLKALPRVQNAKRAKREERLKQKYLEFANGELK